MDIAQIAQRFRDWEFSQSRHMAAAAPLRSDLVREILLIALFSLAAVAAFLSWDGVSGQWLRFITMQVGAWLLVAALCQWQAAQIVEGSFFCTQRRIYRCRGIGHTSQRPILLSTVRRSPGFGDGTRRPFGESENGGRLDTDCLCRAVFADAIYRGLDWVFRMVPGASERRRRRHVVYETHRLVL